VALILAQHYAEAAGNPEVEVVDMRLLIFIEKKLHKK